MRGDGPNALVYGPIKPMARVVRRSFSLLIIIGLMFASVFVADGWETSLDGHHNPKLWLLGDPANYWKGYLGIGLREYQGAATLVCALLLIVELVRQLWQRRNPSISKQVRHIQAGMWAMAVLMLMVLAITPRLDR